MRSILALVLLLSASACAESKPVPDLVLKNVESGVSKAEHLLEHAQPLVEACQASPATRGCPEFLKGYDSTERAVFAAKQALVLGKSAGEVARALGALLDQARALGRAISAVAPESNTDADADGGVPANGP